MKSMGNAQVKLFPDMCVLMENWGTALQPYQTSAHIIANEKTTLRIFV